jgi:hypothetical protein
VNAALQKQRPKRRIAAKSLVTSGALEATQLAIGLRQNAEEIGLNSIECAHDLTRIK